MIRISNPEMGKAGISEIWNLGLGTGKLCTLKLFLGIKQLGFPLPNGEVKLHLKQNMADFSEKKG